MAGIAAIEVIEARLIDMNICEKYYNENNASRPHPMIYALKANDFEAFKMIYDNATITKYEDFEMINWCIKNKKLDIFEIINIKSSKDEIMKMFEEDYSNNDGINYEELNEFISDEIKMMIWKE
jgi:Ca2+-binding EF-hand superfamily protein